MKITSNDIGVNSSAQQAVDSKVVELLAKLAAKPLLIDKLLLSKDSGLQLTLNSLLGKLQLQMPLRLAEQLQPIVNSSRNNKPSLELQLNSRNQVLLKLNTSVPSNNNSTRSTSTAQTSALIQLAFGQAKLVNPTLLKLDSIILSNKDNLVQPNKVSPPPPTGSASLKFSNRSINNELNLTTAIKATGLKGLHTLASQHNSSSLEGKLSFVSLGNVRTDSITSVRVAPSAVAKSSIAPGQIIRNFLSQSFPSKTGIANNIQAIQKQAVELRNLVSKNLTRINNSAPKNTFQTANQVISQANSISLLVNQLTSTIKAPQIGNAKNIIERLTNSGNLFESKLAALNSNSGDTSRSQDIMAKFKTASTQLSQIMNAKENGIQNSLAQVPTTNQTGKVVKNNINQNNFSTVDIKFLLVQIKAQVERLIGQLNSSAAKTSTDSTNQLANQSAITSTAVATDQLRRELEVHNNAHLRKETSDNLGVPNQSKRSNTNLSNLLLTVGQTNQMTKMLSEIIMEVRSALNQIETNQLLSLRTEQPNLHQFLVDLPFANNKQIDSFEILFEHKRDDHKGASKQWKVVVRFDLEPLGPMFAQVELKDNRISTDIFAESQPTAKLINEHLHVLQKSLADAGLDIDKVASSQGKIPESLVKNSDHSVDVRV